MEVTMVRRFTKATAVAAVAFLSVFGAGSASAQTLGIPVALDARLEVAFPLGDFRDIAGTGVGGTFSVAVPVVPAFGVYGSFTHIRFGGGWGEDPSDATTQGFAAGLTTSLPGVPGADPWIGAGLLFHRLEVRGTRTGITNDIGFEIGAGVAVPLTAQLRLSPAIHYRQFGATISALPGLVERDVTAQHLSLGVGLNFWF
jgi:hypothetical protein